MLEMNANGERLQRSHSELLELQLVLEKAGSFFDDAHSRGASRFTSASSPSDSEP